MWSSRDQEETALGRHPGLEYEVTPENSSTSEQSDESCHALLGEPSESFREKPQKSDTKLLLVFCLMVVIGAMNAVFYKLQAVPLYNYPNFLSLFGNFLFIPICFSYIIPVAKFGLLNNSISAEQLAMPKRPFAIMGCLDCLSSMMQIFATVYLPGPLLILLPQAAIPISMVLSGQILGQKYRVFQYIGAVVVLTGILVVLEPVITRRHAPDNVCQAIDIQEDCTICQVETSMEGCLSHRLDVPVDGHAVDFISYLSTLVGNSTDPDDEGQPVCEWIAHESASALEEELVLIWSIVMILSCIPMALSSIYKEIALGDDLELDPIYLNGWIAIFQFIFSAILAVPAGMATSPPVQPMDMPRNIYNGLKCYLGQGSIDKGCHPDAMCASHAFLLVNLCLLVNVFYTLAYTLILKYGSANLLFLALTVMIPIGNFAFALPFMPQVATFHVSDVLGLAVIMTGLFLYRIGDSSGTDKENEPAQELETSPSARLRDPLLTEDI